MSKSQIIRSALVGAFLSASAAGAAQADALVTANLTADNHFQLWVGVGSVMPTLIYEDGDGNQWNQMRKTEFKIPKKYLKNCSCRISIAAWGDGRVAEGVFGSLQSGGNTVHTGTAFQVMNTGMSGPLTAAQVESLTLDSASSPQAVINHYNWPGFPNTGASKWMWDGQRGASVRLFSIPCSKLVRGTGHADNAYPAQRPLNTLAPARGVIAAPRRAIQSAR